MIPNHDPIADYDTLYRIITDRMSVRRLKPDPIPDDYVIKVVEAGCWAMSGANSQPWEFMIVKDEKVKQGLFEAYRDVNTDFIFWMEQMRQLAIGKSIRPATAIGGPRHGQRTCDELPECA